VEVVVEVNHRLDLVPFVAVAHSQVGNKAMALVEAHSLELVAVDTELALEGKEEPGAPEKPIQCIVLRIEGNRLDLVSKKRHNCGRFDTVASKSFLLVI
jgi:hypothetical protein